MQDAENGRQLRSRLTKILNVPRGYASGFVSSVASLDVHFEHPAGVTFENHSCSRHRLMSMAFSAR
ncbi:protein of unknown function [Nitrospira defluvii]|uniref:Uncharacterized protein n=1 Tax=Nitrospira defluvii TaxID=330214 RepID=D8PCC6_9BACT|nr:protein of unknown function [Nitrospira defluvii]